jgi:hypothetical protein
MSFLPKRETAQRVEGEDPKLRGRLFRVSALKLQATLEATYKAPGRLQSAADGSALKMRNVLGDVTNAGVVGNG